MALRGRLPPERMGEGQASRPYLIIIWGKDAGVTIDEISSQLISCVVGNGESPDSFVGAYSGDGGPATEASLFSPHGMAMGINGDLYFADTGNNVVRVVRSVNNTIESFAGDRPDQLWGIWSFLCYRTNCVSTDVLCVNLMPWTQCLSISLFTTSYH